MERRQGWVEAFSSEDDFVITSSISERLPLTFQVDFPKMDSKFLTHTLSAFSR